jgi:hypothetical protein
VDNFYGPEAEDYDEDKLLARRIQVTKDMVALLELCEPSRRGNRVDWKFDSEIDELSEQPQESSPPEGDSQKCPTDVCIICYGISVARLQTLLRIDFLPTIQTLFIVISSTLICVKRTTESVATGRLVCAIGPTSTLVLLPPASPCALELQDRIAD